jgi:hypothetical protein
MAKKHINELTFPITDKGYVRREIDRINSDPKRRVGIMKVPTGWVIVFLAGDPYYKPLGRG